MKTKAGELESIINRLLIRLASIYDPSYGSHQDKAVMVVGSHDKPFFDLLKASRYFLNIGSSFYQANLKRSTNIREFQAADLLLLATARVALLSDDPSEALEIEKQKRLLGRMMSRAESHFLENKGLEREQQFFQLLLDKLMEEQAK